MTRPPDQVAASLALSSAGANPSEIARCLGIPRSTVRDWIAGKLPASGAGPDCLPVGCTNCGHEVHDFLAMPPSYTYLLGLYLGDGCISLHRRGVFRLRITLDAAYPRIIEEAESSMIDVMPRSKVGRLLRPSHDVEVSSYTKAWPCLLPQHGPGKKHLRKIALVEWQEELVRRTPELLLRGLIHSDGCRFINTGRGGWRNPRYAFTNLSADIRTIFTDTCGLLGLRWTSASSTIYVSRKADVARMDSFIGPKA